MAGTWKPYTTTDFGVFLLCFLVVNHPFFCTMKIGYSWLWCLVIMFFIQMPAGDFMVVPVLRRMHISYISYILYTVFIYYIYITIYICVMSIMLIVCLMIIYPIGLPLFIGWIPIDGEHIQFLDYHQFLSKTYIYITHIMYHIWRLSLCFHIYI